MRVENYPNTASTIEDDDLFDLTVKISEGVYESMKLPGATLKALISAGANIGSSNQTQTDATRTYNIDGKTLQFTNGDDFIVSANKMITSGALTHTGALAVIGRVTASQDLRLSGIQTVVSNTTVGTDKSIILINTSGGAIELTLGAVASNNGRVLTIVDYTGNADANNITIKANGSELINGSNTVKIRRKNGFVQLFCNASTWSLMGQLDESGWGYYRDTTLGQSTSIDTPVHIQATKETAIETKLPLNVATYWDDVNFKIPAILDDNVSIQLGFDAEQLTTGEHFIDVWLDVNGEQRYKHFQTLKGHSSTTSINFSISNINQDASWVTNGARLFVRSQSEMTLTNFRLNVSRNFTK
jgi:hypothetical protein